MTALPPHSTSLLQADTSAVSAKRKSLATVARNTAAMLDGQKFDWQSGQIHFPASSRNDEADDRRIRAGQLPARSRGLAQMKRGASILRHRFDTLAHREIYLTALQRVMDDELGHAPGWASKSLTDWTVFWMDGK